MGGKFQKRKGNKEESDLIPVAGIWSKKSQKGDWYGNGSFNRNAFEGLDFEEFLENLNTYAVKIFKVQEEYKTDNGPDFKLYFTKKESRTSFTDKKPAKGFIKRGIAEPMGGNKADAAPDQEVLAKEDDAPFWK